MSPLFLLLEIYPPSINLPLSSFIQLSIMLRELFIKISYAAFRVPYQHLEIMYNIKDT